MATEKSTSGRSSRTNGGAKKKTAAKKATSKKAATKKKTSKKASGGSAKSKKGEGSAPQDEVVKKLKRQLEQAQEQAGRLGSEPESERNRKLREGLNAVTAERDEARGERDQARQERDQAREEREQARWEHNSSQQFASSVISRNNRLEGGLSLWRATSIIELIVLVILVLYLIS